LDAVNVDPVPARVAGHGADLHEGPTAEVDVGAIAHNLETIRSALAPTTKVLAAVKANAYGHGLVGTSLALERRGVEWFGVAAPSEAFSLRGAGITGGVLLLTPVHRRETIAALVASDVSLVVTDEGSLAAILAALPQGRSRPAKLHLKVDTGMGRLGLDWREAARLARLVDAEPRTVLEGVWTHLAASDDADQAYTLKQLDLFHRGVAAIRHDGIDPGLRHVANSAAIFAYPDHHCDMVRPGIVLYGYYPAPRIAALAPGLRQALRLWAPVTFVKRVAAGTSVSYDGLWTAPHDTTIATVRIGYADGYRRGLTGKSMAGLRGTQVPVVGRVCMDQLMVDAGNTDVSVGERVTLFGPGGPSAESLGTALGTVSYEMLVGIAERVVRVYVGDDAVTELT
jgi:alanine racemase